MPVYFYSAKEQPNKCFPNFSAHGLEPDGLLGIILMETRSLLANPT